MHVNADNARAAGTVLSPLAGIPVSVKDLFDIEGQKDSPRERAPACSPTHPPRRRTRSPSRG
ncbi:MAG: Putative amidase R03093 [uncultured Paraburkholderia sp.]|nr:MAG: Putative amidase R03093 [uncultured Paraburkholderia sp.]CAH2927364.1 MAG: Putative amidase R03093 [uncultured Paraburkholderia sp.]